MDHVPDTDLLQPDLAQLLVLESGRILEDITPQMALRLPDGKGQRFDRISSALATLKMAEALLLAASAHASSASAEYKPTASV